MISSNCSGTYQGNTFADNTSYGLYYSASSIIDATNCNWGNPSGPYDPSDDRSTGGWYNPDGKGDKVSDHVNYSSWFFPIPGDINHDGKVDLSDAVLVLQILAGIPFSQPVFLDPDVNQDSRIGIEELTYILGKVTGQR